MTLGWEDIRAEVLRRIRARDWPPGALIPGEEALAEEFGVARATVNRALTALAEAGVVERKKRAGTRVAELPVRRARLEIPVIRLDVLGRGLGYDFKLLADRMAPAPVPVTARLGLPEGQPMRYLETLHLAGGRPYVLETRWLNDAVLPLPAPDFAAVSANEWLVTHVSLVSGDIAFTADPASLREAEVMGVPLGTALLVAERTTHGTGGPVTWVRLAHAPGHRVQMVF
ncbi:GntR family transcriptional regulator [Tabrizicola sp.]|uniref:GntR family transcriptional regulator n=1 Tax=Tabrizicola sp. TaxID=2005166 RepID=UPI00273400CB|nr:GntR family transcriptional regulator [Tabrizicola sp.]MDP3196382.1 GntR family transcriptional regulator [Tabrizicola sp.]